MMVKYVRCPYTPYCEFTACNFEIELYTEYCEAALADLIS